MCVVVDDHLLFCIACVDVGGYVQVGECYDVQRSGQSSVSPVLQ